MFCKNELNERHLPEIWPDKSIPWEKRRAEISDILQRELFGYRPAEPDEISFTELPDESFYGGFCAGKAPLKKIAINVKINGQKFSFPMYSVIPREKRIFPFLYISISDLMFLTDICPARRSQITVSLYFHSVMRM